MPLSRPFYNSEAGDFVAAQPRQAVKEKIAEIERLDKLLESLRGEGTEEEESIEGKHREATSELERLLMKLSLEQLDELGEAKGEWKGTSLDNWWVRGVLSGVRDYKEGQCPFLI